MTVGSKQRHDLSGTLTLTFAGGGAIKLEVECLDAWLTDLSAPWATKNKPGHGLDEAAGWLAWSAGLRCRSGPPEADVQYLQRLALAWLQRFANLLDEKRETVTDVSTAVATIIADVQTRGDAALFDLTKRFDRFDLSATNLRVTATDIAAAKAAVQPARSPH